MTIVISERNELASISNTILVGTIYWYADSSGGACSMFQKASSTSLALASGTWPHDPENTP
jgi:hypothetical protein